MKKSTLFLTYVVLLLILFFINLETQLNFFQIFKAILVLSLATFIPGYAFILLFQDEKLNNPDIIIVSIAMSVCFVIIAGIAIHLLGFRINPYNILNPLWFLISVFTIAIFLSRNRSNKPKKKKIAGINIVFFVMLGLILLFFVILSYLSVNPILPEGFAEVYWEFINVENPWPVDGALCEDMDCSLSGINKLKTVELQGEEYDILFLDLNQPEKYDSICIDINNNDIYCQEREGPFWPSDTFVIDEKTYSYTLLGDRGIVIFFYPKKLVDRTRFTVSYNIKSYYLKVKKYDVTLNLNNNVVSSKEITLNRGEKRLVQEELTIPPFPREHRIEVIVTPEGENPIRIDLSTWYVSYG